MGKTKDAVPVEDILDWAASYERQGSLDRILYFCCDILEVCSDTFYEMLDNYKNR